MENLQSVMFTCMDITMAPGGQGDGWHILRTHLLFLCRGLVDFFKEKDSGVNHSLGSEQIWALMSRHGRAGSLRTSK